GCYSENVAKNGVDGCRLSDATIEDLQDFGLAHEDAVLLAEKILALKIIGVPLLSFIERHEEECSIM
ncbi:unnamed protein product, partial [Heterosigma akashiwo]